MPGQWVRAECLLPTAITPERRRQWQLPCPEVARGTLWGKMPRAHSQAACGQSRQQIEEPMRRKARLRPDFVFVFVVALTEVAGAW